MATKKSTKRASKKLVKKAAKKPTKKATTFKMDIDTSGHYAPITNMKHGDSVQITIPNGYDCEIVAKARMTYVGPHRPGGGIGIHS